MGNMSVTKSLCFADDCIERAQITDDARSYSPTLDHWLAQIEVNAVLRRMPLINDQLSAFFSSYFDSLQKDALKKSPYSAKGNPSDIDELLASSKDIIDSGRKERFDISANSRHSIENSMISVSKCMSIAIEHKINEALQKEVANFIASLLVDETCCAILVTLCTVSDEQTRYPYYPSFSLRQILSINIHKIIIRPRI